MTPDIHIGDVHEITVGPDPKTGMRYTIGKQYRIGSDRVTISEIVFDRNLFISNSIVHVEVYAESEDGEEFLFKEFLNVPITFTPDINANTGKNTH